MTRAPGGKLAAPGHKPQPAAPHPGTAAAAASPRQPRLAVVTLPGQIDATNDGQVQDTLTSALDDGTAVLVADAAATTFCGCAGVTALLFAHHRAAAAGAQLRVVVGSLSMRRILELTAADQVLNTYPTLAAALADEQVLNDHDPLPGCHANTADQAAPGLAAPQPDQAVAVVCALISGHADWPACVAAPRH